MNNETNCLFIRAVTDLNQRAFLSTFVVIHAMLAYSMFVVVVGKFSSRRQATYYRTHKTMAVHIIPLLYVITLISPMSYQFIIGQINV